MGDNENINAFIKTRKDGNKKWKDITAETNTTFALTLTEDAVRKRYSTYVKKLAKKSTVYSAEDAPNVSL